MMSRPTFTCLILMAMVVTYVQSHWSMMEGMWRAQIDLLPVFAAFAAFHGSALLVALYNYFFQGGGPPLFIAILLIIEAALLLYGWKKAID